jgi:hypothetical protein
LQSGAQVDGDVVSSTIAVDSGAVLNGSVHRVEDPFAGQSSELNILPVKERSSFRDSPLWIGSDSDAQRPLTVIRPK